MNKSAVVGFIVGIIAILVVGTVLLISSRAPQPRTVSPNVVQETQVPVAPPAPPVTPPAAQDLAPTELRLSRSIAADGVYQPGAPVDVTLTLTSEGDDPVRAMGVVEHLPDGWTFDSVVSGNRPDLSPPRGRDATLEFVWFNIPKFPTTFTYRLNVAPAVQGRHDITGEALYRTSGPELRSPMVSSAVNMSETAAPATAAAALPPAAPAAPPAPSGEGFSLGRNIAAGGYIPGQPLDVELVMNYGSSDPVTAVAVMETLPAGWTFEKVTGGAAPAVAPKPGAEGVLSFVWINVPSWPASFTYAARVPDGESGVKQLSGEARYRTSGPEERGAPIVTELKPLTP